MERYKEEFVGFLHDLGAVHVDGPYRLKGGRESPYFVNVGNFLGNTEDASHLAEFYLSALDHQIGLDNFDALFGPPDKGNLLALLVGSRVLQEYDRPKKMVYGRKHPKGHGEATGRRGWDSWFFGGRLTETDRLLVLDDVYTEGTSVGQYTGLMDDCRGELGVGELDHVATLVAVDRQESVDDGVHSIITASEFLCSPRTRAELGGEKWAECVDYLQEKGNGRAKKYLRDHGAV